MRLNQICCWGFALLICLTFVNTAFAMGKVNPCPPGQDHFTCAVTCHKVNPATGKVEQVTINVNKVCTAPSGSPPNFEPAEKRAAVLAECLPQVPERPANRISCVFEGTSGSGVGNSTPAGSNLNQGGGNNFGD